MSAIRPKALDHFGCVSFLQIPSAGSVHTPIHGQTQPGRPPLCAMQPAKVESGIWKLPAACLLLLLPGILTHLTAVAEEVRKLVGFWQTVGNGKGLIAWKDLTSRDFLLPKSTWPDFDGLFQPEKSDIGSIFCKPVGLTNVTNVLLTSGLGGSQHHAYLNVLGGHWTLDIFPYFKHNEIKHIDTYCSFWEPDLRTCSPPPPPPPAPVQRNGSYGEVTHPDPIEVTRPGRRDVPINI